ncbi:BTB/POZ domain containing protein [Tritrichomonas foetus]|uniref:BTB/POZ domain containing protein n=1 Tax=Tritrichomonas foetus TaxID=1144522 RepID=A0A1J4JD15_9EUKA|nr:BTB/POZ domain containing protein [Tritrichomonas foetus]|eukprot:OHS95563.1 BTB/POZ domain containing protein [Tritrichomonas foetus]
MIKSMKTRLFSNKFLYFREKNLFLDCVYYVNQTPFRAHRIVLAQYSTLFLEYFCRSNSKIGEFSIPYNEPLFNRIVDFFYREAISINETNPTELMELLSMAYIYDIPTLILIVKSLIKQNLQKIKNVNEILEYTRYYKTVKLNSCADQFQCIGNYYNNFMKSQKMFVDVFVQNFHSFIDSNLSGITPFLLSELLKRQVLSIDKKAQIIDNFAKNYGELTNEECQHLESVIDWNENYNSYSLFAEFQMDWVTSSISRDKISQTLDSRRITIDSFRSTIENFPSHILSNDFQNQDENDNIFSNWYSISWLEEIRNAKGQQNISDCKLFNFLSNIGFDCEQKMVNPLNYSFVESECSPSLRGFEDFKIFEPKIPNNSYYVGNPACFSLEEKPVQAGFRFPQFRFIIDYVEIYSKIGNSYKCPEKLMLFLDENEISSEKSHDGIITFSLNNPIEAKKVVVRLDNNNIFSALRISDINIRGRFSPYV